MQLLYPIALIALSTAAVADTLVVCPSEYQDVLQPWIAHRTSQGHAVDVLEPAASTIKQSAAIRAVAKREHLKNVVLIGDVPDQPFPQNARLGVPTGLVEAQVNVRWGSEPYISTDSAYADLDDDGLPDVAIGRIPVDSAQELRVVVRKILQFESAGIHASSQRSINVVTGAGGIGPTTDMLIEATARQFIKELIPSRFSVSLTRLTAAKGECQSGQYRSGIVRQQLGSESLAWVFAGHGNHTTLDTEVRGRDVESLLSVRDLASDQLATPAKENPLAVLLACYAGAFDGPHDCLAEELLIQPGGPIAVIAATSVSMPYGNVVLGYELLQSCFKSPTPTLGETMLQAKRRLLADPQGDSRRRSLDQLARGLMPPPVDLTAERREHAHMYHLLGDPLLRMRVPTIPDESVPAAAVAELPRTERTKR